MAGGRATALVVALCLGLAACGGDDGGADDETLEEIADGSAGDDRAGDERDDGDSNGGFSRDQCPSFEAFNEIAVIKAEERGRPGKASPYSVLGDIEGLSCTYDDGGASITYLEVGRMTGDRTGEDMCREEIVSGDDLPGLLDGAVVDDVGNRVCAFKGDLVVNVHYIGEPQEGKGEALARLTIDSFGL